jgi:DNA-directed RNA polymerase subunit RPC12/RpoP
MRRSPMTPNIRIVCFDCGREALGTIILQGKQEMTQGFICPYCESEYVITLRKTGTSEATRRQILLDQAKQLLGTN